VLERRRLREQSGDGVHGRRRAVAFIFAARGSISPGIYHWISVTHYGALASCAEGLGGLDIHYTVDVVVTSPTNGRLDVVFSALGVENRVTNGYEVGGTAIVTSAGCGDAAGSTSS
jgi:hypothetical protein